VSQRTSVIAFSNIVGFRIIRKQIALVDSIKRMVKYGPPKKEKRASIEFMRGWLTGFFEGDGSCSTRLTGKHLSRRVTVLATDRDAIDTFYGWLSKFGIQSIRREEKGRRTNWKRQFSIRINIASEQVRFSETISPESPRRRAQISKMLDLITAQSMVPGRITRQSVLPLHANEVLLMRARGATMCSIAEKFGVTPQATFLFLKKRRHLISALISSQVEVAD
jgi:hypothetical protein